MSDVIRINNNIREKIEKYRNIRIKEYENMSDDFYSFEMDIENWKNLNESQIIERALFEILYLKEKDLGE